MQTFLKIGKSLGKLEMYEPRQALAKLERLAAALRADAAPTGRPRAFDERALNSLTLEVMRQPWSYEALAERYGTSSRTIKRTLKDLRLTLRRPLSTERDLRALKDDAKRGPWDVAKLAERHGLTADQLGRVLKKHGLQLKPTPPPRRSRNS
jgi:hypothetical protein